MHMGAFTGNDNFNLNLKVQVDFMENKMKT